MKHGTTTATTDAIAAYKLQARRLREAMATEGRAISHGAALEMVARQHGFRDWNTLSATATAARSGPETGASTGANAAARNAFPDFSVGTRISGRYLDQPFVGEIRSVTALPDGEHFRLAIHFAEPVDVVTFESFSAFRQRVHATVNSRGMSPQRTSNGLPHLVLAL